MESRFQLWSELDQTFDWDFLGNYAERIRSGACPDMEPTRIYREGRRYDVLGVIHSSDMTNTSRSAQQSLVDTLNEQNDGTVYEQYLDGCLNLHGGTDIQDFRVYHRALFDPYVSEAPSVGIEVNSARVILPYSNRHRREAGSWGRREQVLDCREHVLRDAERDYSHMGKLRRFLAWESQSWPLVFPEMDQARTIALRSRYQARIAERIARCRDWESTLVVVGAAHEFDVARYLLHPDWRPLETLYHIPPHTLAREDDPAYDAMQML